MFDFKSIHRSMKSIWLSFNNTSVIFTSGVILGILFSNVLPGSGETSADQSGIKFELAKCQRAMEKFVPSKNINEDHYQVEYAEWQRKMNEFGGFVKRDMIASVIPDNAQSILEFGSSWGHIISKFDKSKLYGLEINPVEVEFAQKTFKNVVTKKRVQSLIDHGIAVDFIYCNNISIVIK